MSQVRKGPRIKNKFKYFINFININFQYFFRKSCIMLFDQNLTLRDKLAMNSKITYGF